MDKRKSPESFNRNKRTKYDMETRIQFSDIHSDIRMLILKLALTEENIAHFDQTWRVMRLVCKTWKAWVSLDRLVPLNNNRPLELHLLYLAIRCNEQAWYETIAMRLEIEPCDFRTMREAIEYDSDKIVQFVLPRIKMKTKFLTRAAELGAIKVLMCIIQTKQTLFTDQINILTSLVKKDRYDVLRTVIQHCVQSPNLYAELKAIISDGRIVEFACERGYTKLLQFILSSSDLRSSVIKHGLSLAAKNGHSHTVIFCLDLKASYDSGFISMVMNDCALHGRIEVIRILWNYAKTHNLELDIMGALRKACNNNRLSTVRMIMKEIGNLHISDDFLASVTKYSDWDILCEVLDFTNLGNVNTVITSAINISRWGFVTKILSIIPHDDIRYILSSACKDSYVPLETIRDLLYRYDADPNTDHCLLNASRNHRNDIVEVMIHHSKISVRIVKQAIRELLKSTFRRFDDTLEILLSALQPLTIDFIPWIIDLASSDHFNSFFFDLLRRVWEDNDSVSVHWRFFYSMIYMTDESTCLHRDRMFDTPPIILHLKHCKLIHCNSDTCSCENAYITYGSNRYSVRFMIRQMLNDLSNDSQEVSSFMSAELFISIRQFFKKITDF